MQIDPQSLRRHYASLSDEELLALDRTELTAEARKYYDEEYAGREWNPAQDTTAFAGTGDAASPSDGDDSLDRFSAAEDPDWLDDAACACSFSTTPGQSSVADADNALEVLQAAGIPCQIEVNEVDSPREEPRSYQEYRVMVPGALNLRAASVLDREIFNSELEVEWRTHLAALSDSELRALSPDVICAGMRDRIERLTRAYRDEAARRMAKLP